MHTHRARDAECKNPGEFRRRLGTRGREMRKPRDDSACSERVRHELAERGYQVVTTPLPSFLRSGGSAFCLTLRLDLQSRGATARADAAAVA